MTARLIPMTKRLFEPRKPRQRPGVRRASGAFGRLAAFEKLQRAGALQNALALMLIAFAMMAARPVHAQWEQLPQLPEPNGGFVCGHEKGKIIVIGGTNWEGGQKNWLDRRHEFDPVQKTWSTDPNVKVSVSYAVVMQKEDDFAFKGGFNGEKARDMIHGVLAAGGAVRGEQAGFYEIVVGGTNDPANLAGVTRETWKFGKNDRRMADYPGKPFITAASAVLGSELFVFGGMNLDAGNQTPVNTDVAYAFTPSKNVWRPLKTLNRAKRGLTAVTLDEKHIYIAGGYADNFTAEAVIYDVTTDSYRAAKSLPYAAMVGLVKLGDYVYCLGGEDKMKHRTDQFFRIAVAELLK